MTLSVGKEGVNKIDEAIDKLKHLQSVHFASDDYPEYCGCDGECFAGCDKSYDNAISDAIEVLQELK